MMSLIIYALTAVAVMLTVECGILLHLLRQAHAREWEWNRLVKESHALVVEALTTQRRP